MKRKTFITILSLVLVLTLSLVVFVACNDDQQQKYTITFKDGDSIIATKSVTQGEALTEDQIPAGRVHDGEEFDGWYVDDQLIEAGYTPTADVTAVAKYHATTPPPTIYTITFLDPEGNELGAATVGQVTSTPEAQYFATHPLSMGSFYEGWFVWEDDAYGEQINPREYNEDESVVLKMKLTSLTPATIASTYYGTWTGEHDYGSCSFIADGEGATIMFADGDDETVLGVFADPDGGYYLAVATEVEDTYNYHRVKLEDDGSITMHYIPSDSEDYSVTLHKTYFITFLDPEGNELGTATVGQVTSTPEGGYFADHPLAMGSFYEGWFVWEDDAYGEQINPREYNGQADVVLKMKLTSLTPATIASNCYGTWTGEHEYGSCSFTTDGTDTTIMFADGDEETVLGVFVDPEGGYYLAVATEVENTYNYHRVKLEDNGTITMHYIPSDGEDYSVTLNKLPEVTTYHIEYYSGVSTDTGLSTGLTGEAPREAWDINAGEQITLLANTWTREGFAFTGWKLQHYIEVTDSNPLGHTQTSMAWVDIEGQTGKHAGDTYTPTENIRITASWTEAQVTVTYDLNGSEDSIGTTVFQWSKPFYVTTESFTAPDGKAFAGWSYTKGGEAIVTTELSSKEAVLWSDIKDHLTKEEDGNYTLTLYAVWEEATVTWADLVGSYTHNSDKLLISLDGAGIGSDGAVGSMIYENEYMLVYKHTLLKDQFYAECKYGDQIVIKPTSDGIDIDTTVFTGKTEIVNADKSSFEGKWKLQGGTQQWEITADSAVLTINDSPYNATLYTVIGDYLVLEYKNQSNYYQFLFQKSGDNLVGYFTAPEKTPQARTFEPVEEQGGPEAPDKDGYYPESDDKIATWQYGRGTKTTYALTWFELDTAGRSIKYTVTIDGAAQDEATTSLSPSATTIYDEVPEGNYTKYSATIGVQLIFLVYDDGSVYIYSYEDDVILGGKYVLRQSEGPAPTMYTVTYSLGENVSGQVPSSNTVAAGTSIQLPEAVEWAEHTFDGWYLGDEKHEAGSQYVVNSSVEFVAHYTSTTPPPTLDEKWITFEGDAVKASSQMGSVNISSITIDVNGVNKSITVVSDKQKTDGGDVFEWTAHEGNSFTIYVQSLFTTFRFDVAEDESYVTIYYMVGSNANLQGTLPKKGGSSEEPEPKESHWITFTSDAGLSMSTSYGKIVINSIKIDVNDVDKHITVTGKFGSDTTMTLEWTERNEYNDYFFGALYYNYFWFHVEEDHSKVTVYLSNQYNHPLRTEQGSLANPDAVTLPTFQDGTYSVGTIDSGSVGAEITAVTIAGDDITITINGSPTPFKLSELQFDSVGYAFSVGRETAYISFSEDDNAVIIYDADKSEAGRLFPEGFINWKSIEWYNNCHYSRIPSYGECYELEYQYSEYTLTFWELVYTEDFSYIMLIDLDGNYQVFARDEEKSDPTYNCFEISDGIYLYMNVEYGYLYLYEGASGNGYLEMLTPQSNRPSGGIDDRWSKFTK